MARLVRQVADRQQVPHSAGQPEGIAGLCCVAGTLIRTPEGEIAVEDMCRGTLIQTHDNGPQPVCWIAPRGPQMPPDTAPICIRAGTLGPHGTLFVPPEARIMIRDSLAAILFGNAEVLVAARDLVNGGSVTIMAEGPVDYVRFGFATPQLIYAHGLVTASVVAPDPQAKPTQTDVRRTLRPFEAQVLMTAAA